MGNDHSPDFHHAQKVKYGLFSQSKAANSKENSAKWPSFELIWDFMAVSGIYKFHKDLIKTKQAMHQTRWNTAFFSSQWQVNPLAPVRLSQVWLRRSLGILLPDH